jgi:GNAT superfamily N-acetyltransferase
MIPRYRIEPLDPHTHDRTTFSCGAEMLDRYLKVTASNDAARNVTRVRVICPYDSPCVIGYYTLSATSLELRDLPPAIAKKMPRYPTLPAILLGRLAIDRTYQQQGIGRRLLVDALQRCLRISADMGAIAVVVDAKDESAAQFYATHDFQRFIEGHLRLFIPMAKLQSLIQRD